MKKTFALLLALLFVCISASAQIIRNEDLEAYAKDKYGKKWNDAAANLASTLTLDKNNALTYSEIIDCQGQTKDQLYVKLNYWVVSSFNDGNSAIQLNDKSLGCIIVQGFLGNIASSEDAFNSYKISMKPIIKIDIKDNKVRVTFTVQEYDAMVTDDGIVSALFGNKAETKAEKWLIDQCYPFAKKDSHKRASSKALIMSHAFSNVIIDKLEAALKDGIIGNENDNW